MIKILLDGQIEEEDVKPKDLKKSNAEKKSTSVITPI